MIGRRIYPTDFSSLEGIEPGDYWKAPEQWYAACPCPLDDDGMPLIAALCNHTVIEHEDGTITVSPSILVGGSYPFSPPEWAAKHTWHGWLEHGVWRTA
jgi:hypothetical protein